MVSPYFSSSLIYYCIFLTHNWVSSHCSSIKYEGGLSQSSLRDHCIFLFPFSEQILVTRRRLADATRGRGTLGKLACDWCTLYMEGNAILSNSFPEVHSFPTYLSLTILYCRLLQSIPLYLSECLQWLLILWHDEVLGILTV